MVENSYNRLPSSGQASRYADPVFASKEIKNLKNLFLNDLGFGLSAAKPIKRHYDEASSLGRIAILQFFKEAVNTYDGIIKQLSGSTQFPEDRALQTHYFAEILEGYLEMMESSVKMISKQEEGDLMTGGYGAFTPFDRYISKLKTGGDYKFGYNPKLYSAIGFETLVNASRSSATPNFSPKEQFSASSRFNVSGIMIGSHADLNFSVHWPTTLEEYFTTFHQNMEQVYNVLITQTGINIDMFAEQPRRICQKICDEIQQNWTFSLGGKDEKKVEVLFQIPLRQHAATIAVNYDPQNPDEGVEITVKILGNHERQRWYQTAFIGAWLGSSEGLSFTGHTAPSIDWNAPETEVQSVEFSLHVDSNYHKIEELVSILSFTMKTVATEVIFLVKDDMIEEKLNVHYPFQNLQPEFFSATLYGIDNMMDKIAESGNTILLGQAIHHAVLGLIKNRAFNSPLSTKVIVAVRKHVAELVECAPKEIISILESFHSRKDLKEFNPQLCKFFEEESIRARPPLECFEVAIEKKIFPLAILTAEKTKSQFMKNKLIKLIKNLSEENALEIYTQCNYAMKCVFELEYLEKLDPQVQVAVQNCSRETWRKLGVGWVWNINSFDFNLERKDKLDLFFEILVGLNAVTDMEYIDFKFSFDDETHAYLGNPKYNYIPGNDDRNNLSSTKQLKTVIPLLLIKAMESRDPGEQAKAFEVVGRIIASLVNSPFHHHRGELTEAIAYGLSRGYYENSEDKVEAAVQLQKMWKKYPERIDSLLKIFL